VKLIVTSHVTPPITVCRQQGEYGSFTAVGAARRAAAYAETMPA